MELAIQGKYEHGKAMTTTGNWIETFKDFKFLPVTAKDAINAKTPSLATYRKYQGEATTTGLIAQSVCWVLNMLNIQKKPNDGQVLMISMLIFNEYHFLKISEIKYCFLRGLYGDYGELYGKLDVMDLLKWLGQYCETRSAILVTQNTSKSNENKKFQTWSPEAALILQELNTKIQARTKERKVEEVEGRKERQQQAELERAKQLITSFTEILQSGSLDNHKEQKQEVEQTIQELQTKIQELQKIE